MATLPTFPTFTTNDSSLTKLQQLSDSVKFLTTADPLVANTRPLWHLYKNSTLAISASTVTLVPFGQTGIDTDSVFTSTGYATIKTQGIYVCEATLPIASTATNKTVHAWFEHAAGSSNPNHTAGTTNKFAATGGCTGTDSTRDVMITFRGQSNWVAYPNDTIKVMLWMDNTGTLEYTNGTSWASFTGYWHQQASTP